MKTMIFWLRKGCRKPKMQGLATAPGSASTIEHFVRMAKEGRGRLFIVDGDFATEGRELIDEHLRAKSDAIVRPSVVGMKFEGDRILALGVHACAAIAGATEATRNWDHRLARDGRVKIADTTALGRRTDGRTPQPHDWFGR